MYDDSFTDGSQIDIDSGFTDSPPQEEELPADTVEILPNGDPPVITATPTPVQITATPTPAPVETTLPPEADELTPSQDSEAAAPGDSSETETEYTIDDIYNLLTARVQELDERRTSEQEELTEYRTYMTEQSRNVLSVTSLIFLTVAFLTGILLARIVWRKL